MFYVCDIDGGTWGEYATFELACARVDRLALRGMDVAVFCTENPARPLYSTVIDW